jgi:hypothetical protein
LRREGRTAVAADLAATAMSLPVVSITASVGHELFPLDPTGGTVLSIRDAIVAMRAELTAVAAREPTASESPPPTPPPGADGRGRAGVFRRTGDHWEIGFDGDVVTLRSTKGMEDLVALLSADGREIHSLELAGSPVVQGSAGEALDATARREYENRVRELQRELDDAEADNDRGRAERARVELDAIVDQLTAALGLGRRARTAGSGAERARSAVTQRIRTTIRRIDEVHPRLGRHLRASIRTGTYCSYMPEEPTRWDL